MVTGEVIAVTCPKTPSGLLRTACATRLLPLVLLCTLPATVQAQDYIFTTNNGTITITAYTGSGGDVTIAGAINGLPVTSIGDDAFYLSTNLTSVTISDSVTSIGNGGFALCRNLSSVAIPNSVTNIGLGAFSDCNNLSRISVGALNSFYTSADGVLFDKRQTTVIQCPGATAGSYTVPNSVSIIGILAFSHCINLTNVTIPSNVTSLENGSFWDCASLTGVCFLGNAPGLGWLVFANDIKATVYYVAGTAGWGTTFGGLPTARWNPPVQPKPNITCSAPMILECTNGAAVGTVDASVQDTGGNSLVIVWEVDGIPYETNGIPSGGTLTASNLTFTASFGLGEHLVLVSASNGGTSPATCSTPVTVRDTTPPQILSIRATPNVLWPPNHRMVPVSVIADAVDNCDPSPVFRITQVTSNERQNTSAPDWEITGPQSLNLRAERLGTGEGRIYTIIGQCEDVSGNVSSASVKVTVTGEIPPDGSASRFRLVPSSRSASGGA